MGLFMIYSYGIVSGAQIDPNRSASAFCRDDDEAQYFKAGPTNPGPALSCPCHRDRNSLPNANAHGRRSILPLALYEFESRRSGYSHAGHTERMAKGDSASVRIDTRVVVSDAKFAQTGEALACKGFVQFDDVEDVMLKLQTRHQLPASWHRSDAHDTGRDTRGSPAQNTRDRRQAVLFHRLLTGKDHHSRAVIHAAGIARRYAATLPEWSLQTGQGIECCRARMFILAEQDGGPFR